MKFGRFVQRCLNSNGVGVCVMILMEQARILSEECSPVSGQEEGICLVSTREKDVLRA